MMTNAVTGLLGAHLLCQRWFQEVSPRVPLLVLILHGRNPKAETSVAPEVRSWDGERQGSGPLNPFPGLSLGSCDWGAGGGSRGTLSLARRTSQPSKGHQT